MENTNRRQYLDALKGFLIILVPASHIILFYYPDGEKDHLLRFIMSFYMPLFMFISGYFCYRPNKVLDAKKAISQRFTRLIPPFFLWSFFITPVLRNNWNPTKLLNILIDPDQGLWFLWVLFVLYVFFVLLSKIAERIKINQSLVLIGWVIALFVIYLVTNFRYFGFQFVAWHFIWFTCGFLFHRYETFLDKYWKYLFAVSAIIFPILAWNWQITAMPVLFGFSMQSSLWLYVYKGVTALISIPFFMYLFRMLDSKVSFFTSFGNNTIGIYAMHFLLLGWIVKPIHTYIHTTNTLTPYIFLIVMTAVVIVICNVLIYWIRKVKVLKWLLLGEKDK
jgi:fucose 4-O-acetylase-like acetyltransferase